MWHVWKSLFSNWQLNNRCYIWCILIYAGHCMYLLSFKLYHCLTYLLESKKWMPCQVQMLMFIKIAWFFYFIWHEIFPNTYDIWCLQCHTYFSDVWIIYQFKLCVLLLGVCFRLYCGWKKLKFQEKQEWADMVLKADF